MIETIPQKTKNVTKLIPPDGGWGWVMLIGIAVCNVFNLSMPSSFGLLYGDALEAMGHRTQGAALILNTVFFVSIIGGPIAGVMIKLTSPRFVAITGTSLCAVGVFLSGFSANIWHLLITYGVLTGLGIDLITVSSFVAINSYFELRKSRAVGLALTGTSLGQMLMPHIVRFLLETYGYRGACMLLSALSLQGVAGCMLIQPIERHLNKVQIKEITIAAPVHVFQDKQNNRVVNKQSERNPFESISDKQVTNTRPTNENEILHNKANTGVSPVLKNNLNFLRKIYSLFAVNLLYNPRFVNILIGLAISTTTVRNFGMIYPFFLEKQALLNKQETANCMSAVAVGDVVGRFTIPIIQDKYKIKGRWILVITCIWLIIIRQILAYQSYLEVIIALSILYGYGRSMTVVQRNIIISQNCKPIHIPPAVGLGRFSEGTLALPLGYFLGWVRDYTDSYVAHLTVQNVMLVVMLLMWLPDMIYVFIKEHKQRTITHSF